MECKAIVLRVVCLALGCLAIVGQGAGCAGYKAGGGLPLSVVLIPPPQLNLYSVEPSAMQDGFLMRGNSLDGAGRRADPQVAASFRVDWEGKTPAVRLLSSSELRKDNFVQCLTADGSLLVSQGFSGAHPVLWSRDGADGRDVSPANLAEVAARPHLPGLGVRDCDAAGNLYVSLRQQGGADELWVGKDALKQVEGLPDLRCWGAWWSEAGRRVVLLTKDGRLLLVNGASAELAPLPGFDWVASLLDDEAGLPPEELRYIALVDGLACIRLKTEIRLCAQDGKSRSIRLFSTVDKCPSGVPRTEAEAQRIIDEPQYLLGERDKLPADLVSKRTQCMPLNQNTIALVDPDYMRVMLARGGAGKAN